MSIRKLWDMRNGSGTPVEAQFARRFIEVHTDELYAQDCWERTVDLQADEAICPDGPKQTSCCEQEAMACLAPILQSANLCPWCEAEKNQRSVEHAAQEQR